MSGITLDGWKEMRVCDCTKPFLVQSHSDTCVDGWRIYIVDSIYKYHVWYSSSTRCETDNRGSGHQPFFLCRGHLVLIKWNISNTTEKIIKVISSTGELKISFLSWKKLFKNLYINYTFYDFSFQLIYLSSSLLFFIGFT